MEGDHLHGRREKQGTVPWLSSCERWVILMSAATAAFSIQELDGPFPDIAVRIKNSRASWLHARPEDSRLTTESVKRPGTFVSPGNCSSPYAMFVIDCKISWFFSSQHITTMAEILQKKIFFDHIIPNEIRLSQASVDSNKTHSSFNLYSQQSNATQTRPHYRLHHAREK